jgi:hydroxymethylbilane synthase
MGKIRIGSRGSKLAMWQAQFIQTKINQLGCESDIQLIDPPQPPLPATTAPLNEKEFYCQKLEEALLEGSIDLAVHSMKDLPPNATEGLSITALSDRENPSDWLVIRKDRVASKLFRLADRALVAASSARRKAQLLHYRPDLQVQRIQGPVPDRLEQLRSGAFDAIILAAAALIRLQTDLSEFEIIRFNPREFVPAPGQGVLALQTRTDDLETRRALKPLHHPEIARCTNVERRVLQLFGGDRDFPLGVFCERDAMGHYHVWAALAGETGVLQIQHSQSTTDQLAEKVFELLSKG